MTKSKDKYAKAAATRFRSPAGVIAEKLADSYKRDILGPCLSPLFGKLIHQKMVDKLFLGLCLNSSYCQELSLAVYPSAAGKGDAHQIFVVAVLDLNGPAGRSTFFT